MVYDQVISSHRDSVITSRRVLVEEQVARLKFYSIHDNSTPLVRVLRLFQTRSCKSICGIFVADVTIVDTLTTNINIFE